MKNINDRVIIAGAGPIGLICGYWLARKGISVSIFDKSSGIPLDLRASTWHPVTLDLLSEYGVDLEIIKKGSITPSWQYRYQDTGERAIFELEVLKGETNHPYRVQCEQFHIVRYLSNKINELENSSLSLNSKVINFNQDKDGVSVIILKDGKQFTEKCKF